MPRQKPKKYKQPSLVSGLSIDDILNMDIVDFNRLSEKDLKLVVGRLVSAGNKRLRRMKAKGLISPAMVSLDKTPGGMGFSVKGKKINELRKEYARARNFLTKETSTVKGYTKVLLKTVDTLRERGINITPDDLERVFKVWNRLVEIDPTIKLHDFKYDLWEDIARLAPDLDIDTKVQKMQERYTELYEQQKEQEFGKEVTLYGVSGFFEI